MEYRGTDWKNPYGESAVYKPGINSAVENAKYEAYEEGGSAMGEHILSLLKEKAPSSSIIDILEGRKR